MISVSLDEAIEAAHSQLGAAIKETGATITHAPLPTVTGEHSQITRLFLNLIGNAIEYRSPDRSPTIHIGAEADEQRATISVIDTALVLPRSMLNRSLNLCAFGMEGTIHGSAWALRYAKAL